jgi:predicted transcriptional regulator
MQEIPDTERKIQKIIYGPQLGALLYSVLNFRIPQLLSSGPKTVDELTQEVPVPKDKLERVLLALETEGIFDYKSDTKQFSLTEISNCLLHETYADYIKLALTPWSFDFLSVVPEVLKQDKTAPEVRYGEKFSD